jgi:hypothetical protein
MSRPAWIVISLSLTLGLWFAFGHHVGQSRAKSPAPPAEHRPTTTYARLPDTAPMHGLAWQITHVYEVVEKARRLIPEIAELGADTVMISAAWYQKDAGSPAVYRDDERMPTEAQWRQIFQIAHDQNLRVILMPIVLLSEPRGTEWRGQIKPPNWDDWFAGYETYIVQMARIAAANGVDMMTVGSELVSTEKYTDHWRHLIRAVRRVYPGRLSYSANWDHYRNIEYWNDLDYIGMTTYHKLSDEDCPTLEALIEAWKPIKERILEWQATIGKPILFTEVGWCSQEGASVEAWNYYRKQEATKAGHEEQRRLYEAFIATWDNVPQVGGVIWWEWTESPGGPEDYNYTPRNKPAEQVLRRWFAAQRAWVRENPDRTVEGTGRTPATTCAAGGP